MWSCAMKCVLAALAALKTIDATALVIGVSLPLGSQDESLVVPAKHIRNGLHLLADRVNDNKIFKDLRGDPLVFQFLIKDDGGDVGEALDNYRGFMQQQSADMMLGPYGEETITDVAREVRGFGYAQVLHSFGILEESLTPGVEPAAFSVSVPVTKVLFGCINATKKLGASSMVLIADAQSTSFVDMCASAMGVAHYMGFTIEGHFKVSDATDAINKMRLVAAINPDVVVLCGQVQRMQSLVGAAASVSLRPQAILASGVSSDFFISSMGSSLASYLLTAVDWHKDVEVPCKVFGSNAEFVERYKAAYGEDPDYYVASAVAAAIALMEAVSTTVFQGTAAEKQKQLSDSLRQISIPSMYGRLQFTAEGTPADLNSRAIQLIPTEDFGVRSALIPQDNASAMVWPMPSWYQKNAYLKACPPGRFPGVNFREPQINRSQLQCLPCPPGKSLYGESDVCNYCDTGTFAKDPGSNCVPCPLGSTCEKTGIIIPNASKNYYLLRERSDGELLYVACSPKFLCLGRNTCEGFNAGVLCRSCSPGSTNVGFHRRYYQCFPCAGAGVLVVIAMLTVAFQLWLGHICCDSELSGTVHVVKRLISYAQLCGIAMQAGDLHTIAPILGMLADFVVIPFQTVLGTDCLFTVKAPTLASGAIDHAALAENKRDFIRLFPLVLLAGLVFFTTAMCLVISIFRFTQLKDGRRHHRSTPDEGFRGTIKRALWWSARWGIFWLYLFYVPTTTMLLNSVQFTDLDTYRLRHHPDVIPTLSNSVASIVCLIIFSAIIPASGFYLFWKRRHDLEKEENIEIFGFLHSEFLPDYWHFECRFFLFKFVFMLCLLIPRISSKLFFMLLCLFLHSLSFARFLPFAYRDGGILLKLEICCIACVTCILLSQNSHNWQDTNPSADQIGVEPTKADLPPDIGMHVLVWCCHAYCLVRCAAWFYKTVIFEHIRLKAHALPESLNAFEKKLSASMPVRTLQWLGNIQTLDITSLPRSEKKSLYGVLDNAMSTYIDHGKLFHPSFLVLALEEAMKTCIIDRRAKMDAEHPVIMSQLRAKGLLGCLLFWFPWQSKMLGMVGQAEGLDAKTNRLERQSRLRALRRCSINSATSVEFQDALSKQLVKIKHRDAKFYTMVDMPGLLRLPDDDHDDAPHGSRARRTSISSALSAPAAGEDLLEAMMADANAAMLEDMKLAQLQAEASARDLGPEGSREELIDRLKASTPIEAKAEYYEARIPELMDEAAMLRAEVDRLQEEIRQAEEEAAWAYDEDEDRGMEAVAEEEVVAEETILEQVVVEEKMDPLQLLK